MQKPSFFKQYNKKNPPPKKQRINQVIYFQ